MATKDIFRMTIDLNVEDHKRLKAIAALNGKPMRDVIVEALDAFYKTQQLKSNRPNTETRKTLDEIKAGKGITKCESIEDIFKKLGI